MPRLRFGRDPKSWPRPDMPRIIQVCKRVRETDGWLGRRNAALISTLPLFGSRARENTMLKKEHVEIGDSSFFVTFSILKLHSIKKVRCTKCGKVSRLGWTFCPVCGSSLEGLKLLPYKEAQTDVTRQRSFSHPLAGYFVDWVKEVPPGAWIFPSSGANLEPQWDKPLSRQGVYMVVRRNMVDYWPHLFRHNLATGFSKLGYTENDLMKWFGWTRYETAVRYTRLGGGARIKSMGESTA
jgi:integrase